MKNPLATPLNLGPVELPNRVLLAPLAGVSDIPFRRICGELGAGLSYVEMLSATGIRYRAKRTEQMMARHPDEPLLGVQLTGPDPDEIAWGVECLEKYPFDLVDLNMGCPVRKIVGKGWGSALLREPELVGAIVRRVREVTARPVTVKIRLGYTPETVNVETIARQVADAGASALTIHGRTRADSYLVRVSYPGIRDGVDAARAATGNGIVLIGNGDVLNRESALRMFSETGCDAIMISRGALGNPWIFREILTGDIRGPTVEEWRDVLLRHVDYHAVHYRGFVGTPVMFRKHLLWYLNGYPGARRCRAEASLVASMDEVREVVNRFAAALPPDLRRYDDKAHSLLKRPSSESDPKGEMDSDLDRGVGDEGGGGQCNGPLVPCCQIPTADRVSECPSTDSQNP